jgi:hypothetical protein
MIEDKVNGPGYYKDGGLIINRPNIEKCLMKDMQKGDLMFPKGEKGLDILDAKVIIDIDEEYGSMSVTSIAAQDIQEYVSGVHFPVAYRVYNRTHSMPVYRWKLNDTLKNL